MKKIILTLCVVFSIVGSIFPQSIKIYPRVGLDYHIRNRIIVSNTLMDYPKLSTLVGFGTKWKKIEMVFDNTVWVNGPRKGVFSPSQALYQCKIDYEIFSKVKIGIDHFCYHPIRTINVDHTLLYGGGTGVYIHFGY